MDLDYIKYNFEYAPDEKVKIGYIGCGGHSYRNIFPTFQYAPVELVACCDLDLGRAEAYCKLFGGQKAYTDHRAMLENEELDAVFIVTGYDEHGHPLASKLAIEAMRAGKHVWMEKPPAANIAEIQEMQAVSRETGKFVLVGFKKIFFPAIEKVKSIITSVEFGPISSVYIRYPQALPENNRDDKAMVGFLDHIVHPGSILQYLIGPIENLYYLREKETGATTATLRFASGAIGTLNLAASPGMVAPMEHLEILGHQTNVVVANNIHLTYYRKARRAQYGRGTVFTTSEEVGPLYWEPQFSLGTLENKALFLLGYAQEVLYFCECVKTNTPPDRANLDDALELMKLYEAYRHPEGTVVTVNAKA